MKQELKDCSYADYFYNAMFGYPLPRQDVAANQQPQGCTCRIGHTQGCPVHGMMPSRYQQSKP